MKIQLICTITAVSILIAGCGKQNGSSGTSQSPAQKQTSTTSVATSVALAPMTAWQQGDTTTAVNDFLVADWSARPLFSSSSPLSLTEDQYDSISDDHDRYQKINEAMSQLHSLKLLALAVVQAGNDAAAKGDTGQAQKYFNSVKQCGIALDSTNYMLIVQILGRGFKGIADQELAKIGQ